VDRRSELLDALADHVQRSGLSGTSLRSLAAAAGVRHNTLTHHFGSRSELLAAVFERIAQRMSTVPEQPHPGAGTDAQSKRLRDVWGQLTASSFLSTWSAFYEVLGMSLRNPEGHAVFLRHVTTDWTEPLTQHLVSLGRPRPESEAAATFVVATMRGLVMDALSGGDDERLQRALALLESFVHDHLETGRLEPEA